MQSTFRDLLRDISRRGSPSQTLAPFGDQCSGANPRIALISELKQILLDSNYCRGYQENYEYLSTDETDTIVVSLVRA